MKEKIVCLRLSEDLLEKILITAKSKNISKSTLIREILINYMEGEKKEYNKDILKDKEMGALASLSKEYYLLKRRVDELETYQKRTYELLTQLIASLKTSVLKE